MLQCGTPRTKEQTVVEARLEKEAKLRSKLAKILKLSGTRCLALNFLGYWSLHESFVLGVMHNGLKVCSKGTFDINGASSLSPGRILRRKHGQLLIDQESVLDGTPVARQCLWMSPRQRMMTWTMMTTQILCLMLVQMVLSSLKAMWKAFIEA